MSQTLSQILTDANSVLDLEANEPTGDELTLRSNLANRAVRDAASTGQLSEFKATYEVNTSTLATISLPNGFRELQIHPQILDSSGSWVEYPEIEPEERYDYAASDRYSYVLGNPQGGYFLYLNGVISMATLSIVYQRFPSGMPTLSSVCELSDPGFVSGKVEEYVMYARSDDRFPIAQALNQQRLQNLIGREMKTSGGQVRTANANFTNPLK